ncbi:hypothetical protein VTG60DRAFT_1941 [Thermothelomyces hinnuleus]
MASKSKTPSTVAVKLHLNGIAGRRPSTPPNPRRLPNGTAPSSSPDIILLNPPGVAERIRELGDRDRPGPEVGLSNDKTAWVGDGQPAQEGPRPSSPPALEARPSRPPSPEDEALRRERVSSWIAQCDIVGRRMPQPRLAPQPEDNDAAPK